MARTKNVIRPSEEKKHVADVVHQEQTRSMPDLPSVPVPKWDLPKTIVVEDANTKWITQYLVDEGFIVEDKVSAEVKEEDNAESMTENGLDEDTTVAESKSKSDEDTVVESKSKSKSVKNKTTKIKTARKYTPRPRKYTPTPHTKAQAKKDVAKCLAISAKRKPALKLKLEKQHQPFVCTLLHEHCADVGLLYTLRKKPSRQIK